MLDKIIGAGASIIGGLMGKKSSEEAAEKNANIQREFAQNSIRWRVEDAKAAGIHPLYAIGAPTISASPSYVGDTLGTSVAAAGQDLSRAMNTTRTQPERDAAFTKTVQDLQLQKFGLENELLASQIAKLRATTNPPMPTLGPVPEDDSFNKRPRLLLGGEKVRTDPNTSNMDDYSKRYGDEGLPQWAIPPLIMWQDMKANYGNVDRGIKGLEWMAQRAFPAYGLSRRFGSKVLGRR